MEEECLVPDSTFYICFASDLKRKDWLYEFVNIYSVYLGKRILREISNALSDDRPLLSAVKMVEVDYYELIMPYFGRDAKHIEDGEYEAIGIAHFLEIKGCLKYLIIDEDRARNFVNKHFPYLANKLVGTVGFIRDSCCKDKKISVTRALMILNSIKEAVKLKKINRPCSMDRKSYGEVLIPTIEYLEKIGRGCE